MFSVAIAFLFGALLYVPCSELDYPEYTVLSKVVHTAPDIHTFTECTSGISNSGCSEIRTVSLQRTQLDVPECFLPILPIHLGPPEEDNLLTKDK